MRKLWLTFTAMLLCSIASFAQTQFGGGEGTETNPYLISDTSHFKAIAKLTSTNNTFFKLTADINLGDLGERTASIIPTFSGTLDGNGKTITYQASFTGTSGNTNYSLFGSVSGTIDSLNVQGNVTLAGSVNNMDVALLCAYLTSTGVIEYCNVSGNVNSTVNASLGGSDAGLIAGQSEGIVRYCIGNGNVVGVGYVGGLIGQTTGSASVLACSFTGSVTANYPATLTSQLPELGNFAGGICGNASDNTNFSFCTVNGSVNRERTDDGDAEGITCSSKAGFFGLGASVNGGGADVANCYGNGVIDGITIDADNDLADNSGTIGDLYYKGEMEPDQIVEALNNAIPNNQKDKFYFDVINGEVVLIIGQRPFICESPVGLTVSVVDGIFTASWSVENQNESYNESIFTYSITGGAFGEQVVEGNVSGTTLTQEQQIPFSENPYVFTIKSKCDTEYSNALTYTFYVNENCTSINALQANNVTATSANITWQGEADEVRLNGEAVAFTDGQTLVLEDLTPATTYTIEAIVYCTHDGETETLTTSVDFITHVVEYETAQTGRFNDPNTWLDNVVPEGDVATITINTGHKVIVEHNLKITDDYKIAVNNGVLQITQQGQLINDSDVNVPGIVEIVTPQKKMNSWTFIGAPFENNYKLGTIYPMSHDISVSRYDYEDANWSESWAYVGDTMDVAEGYFAWPFYDGAVIFTTYGDVWNYTEGKVGNYVFNGQTATNLNNTDITFERTIAQSNNGYWMALSNPYPAKLHVNAFKGQNNLQGNCLYVFKDGAFDMPSNDEIAMTEGFFVNVGSAGQKSITFTKEQLSYNATAKASANEFIKLTLINGNKKVRAYLAHNEEAEQGYDIFDANKMFAPTEVTEPYFVTDGIALMKEEFAELPYYATMNVRSFADDTVSFVVENIPEGLSVSIIDGENIIDMVEGGVYSTEILTGENADRFKVLVKKSVSISDVEELEVNITNNNRHISIETTETDLQVEVYNALGQKVLSTKDRNFTLNQVSAGAYLIKAFNNKASKTQKIVVE